MVDDDGLMIDASREGEKYVIRVMGELDLNGCPRLELALSEAEVSDAGRILLDIEGLTFIDSTGLGTILRASRRSDRTGRRLRITHGSGYVADAFRLTALDQTLPFTNSSGG